MSSTEPVTSIAGNSVVLVLSSLGAGGAEGVIAQLANHWARSGCRVTVIAFDHPADPIYHHFDDAVAFVRLGLPPGGGRLAAVVRSAQRVRLLRATVRRLEPTLIVSFLLKINVTVLLACRGLGIPIIVSERNHPSRGAGSPWWQWARVRLYPQAAAVVLQTEASRRALPPAVARRGIVIPNPVKQRSLRTGFSCTRTLVAVGRLEEQKGFDLLLEAYAIVCRRHPEWQLVIWGEGGLRRELESQVKRLGLSDRVSLPGVTDNPGGWTDSASALVVSSRYEGFCNVIVEALASGVPVVSFDCEFGPADILDDGKFGLLVPPEDIIQLAAGLERMLSDAELRRCFSSKGIDRARDFSRDVVMSAWDDLQRAKTNKVAPTILKLKS